MPNKPAHYNPGDVFYLNAGEYGLILKYRPGKNLGFRAWYEVFNLNSQVIEEMSAVAFHATCVHIMDYK